MNERFFSEIQSAAVNGPPVKVIFFDMDGTLLYGTGAISPGCREEMQRLKARGIRLSLATGRGLFSALPVARELQIDQPSMFFSGSLIINPLTDEPLWAQYLRLESGRKFLAALRAGGFYTEVYTQNAVYVEERGHFAEIHEKYLFTSIIVRNLDEVLEGGRGLKFVTMVNRGDDELRMRDLMLQFPELSAGVSIGAADPDVLFFNITPITASRDVAFDVLLDLFGVRAEETAAFGDAESDMVFLRRSGYGFAMGDSPQIVKDAARFVTGTAEEGGVAQALRALVG